MACTRRCSTSVRPAAVTIARGSDVVALLHGGARAQQAPLSAVGLRPGTVEGAAAGELRTDVVPDELAAYCLRALAAPFCRGGSGPQLVVVALIASGSRHSVARADRRWAKRARARSRTRGLEVFALIVRQARHAHL
jgi:hypothetical protein